MKKQKDQPQLKDKRMHSGMIAWPAGLIGVVSSIALTGILVSKTGLPLILIVPVFSLIGAAIMMVIVILTYLYQQK